MPQAPIRVRPNPYKGTDRRRLDRLRREASAADQLEAYINARVPIDGCETFVYGELSVTLRLDEDLVADLLAGAGGGNTGIRVWGRTYRAPDLAPAG
jgi:hypothetical protein